MVRRFRVPTREEVAAPFRSREAFVNFVKAPEDIEGHATVGDARWSNKDLEPTPLEHRTWTWCAPHTLTGEEIPLARLDLTFCRYNLPLYWFSNQFSLTGWNTGSSLVAVGLVCPLLLPPAATSRR